MKKKELKDLRTKETADLVKVLKEKKKELSEKGMSLSAGKEKNLKIVRNIRREVAQILTVIREKDIIAKQAALDTKIEKPEKEDKEEKKSSKSDKK